MARHKITSDEAKLMNKKSQEARRKRKETRALIDYVLSCKETNEEVIKALKKLGFTKDLTNNLTIVCKMMQKAKGGDVNSARLLYQLHGDLDGNNEQPPTETPTFRLEFVKNEDNAEPTEATDNES